jgi:nucleoside phosphorylase/CheY-like chemotaxis protein
MKVLIVDDNQEKRRILAALAIKAGIPVDAIDQSMDVRDAKIKLRSSMYDLVILDINLPKMLGQRAEVGAGCDVLRYIKKGEAANTPRFLFGLTAFDDGFAAAEREFSGPLWKLVQFSFEDTSWEEPILEALIYIASSANYLATSDGQTHHTDIALIVALEDEELEAVLGSVAAGWKRQQVRHDHTTYYRGILQGKRREVSVVVAACPRMGLAPAAVVTSKLIHTFRPRIVAMAGICAGVRGKAELGDVLVADPCFDWGSGKWVRPLDDGPLSFKPAAYQWRLDDRVRALAKDMSRDTTFLDGVKGAYGGVAPRQPPRVLIDAMASGASVLQAKDLVDGVREHHKNLIGIEMESYAVFTACEYASEPRPLCVSAKGVCDFGDEQKGDDFHHYAAHVSAMVAAELALRVVEGIDLKS